MTNEWGLPLTGEEMKALEGRIDPGTPVMFGDFWNEWEIYSFWEYDSNDYSLPANHPYYKVREHNAKHGTNLVLHDGSAKVPEDWGSDSRCLYLDGKTDWTGYRDDWRKVLAYTPKPKESEVTEQFPSDEAIIAALNMLEYGGVTLVQVKSEPNEHYEAVVVARLIQQYEPDRLKPAVDVAAEEWAGMHWGGEDMAICAAEAAFKAGAVWQKENGK